MSAGKIIYSIYTTFFLWYIEDILIKEEHIVDRSIHFLIPALSAGIMEM